MNLRQPAPVQGPNNSELIETSEKNAAVELLNDLITTNRGIVKVYKTAAKRLEDETNTELLQNYASQHADFITKLSNLVTSYSGTPATDPDSSSYLKQTWVSLKAAVTEGDGPILNEVAQDAEKVLETYGEAMNEDLPDDARDMIRQQMSEMRLSYEKISALSAAYNS